MLRDFLSLIFPVLCPACKNSLMANEEILCTECLYRLPTTGFHLMPDNPVARRFWGKLPVHAAGSYLYFRKGESVQRVIHELKYRGRREIGLFTGKLYGQELASSPLYRGIDLILPVPLHSHRLRKRGYNQSMLIAEGISLKMEVPCADSVIKRTRDSTSQTNKSRFSRWENMQAGFVIRDHEKIENKHVLLVDDVITTGATLESCAHILLKEGAGKVSIATLACA
jgi:ComF family protein